MAFCACAQEADSLSLKDRIFYHYDRSEFTEVVQCCEEAHTVYKATDDLFEMAGCYNILGIAYQRLGRYKEAIESYELCAQGMNTRQIAKKLSISPRTVEHHKNNIYRKLNFTSMAELIRFALLNGLV